MSSILPPHWPPQSQPLHSVEIEHRLTIVENDLENVVERHEEKHEAHEEKYEALTKRMSLHEKATLVLAGAVQILAQDKYPALAKIIRSVLTP
jgi:hypothetical protein